MENTRSLKHRIRTLKQENHDRMVLYIDLGLQQILAQFPELSAKEAWSAMKEEMLEGDCIMHEDSLRKNSRSCIRYYTDNLTPSRKTFAQAQKELKA